MADYEAEINELADEGYTDEEIAHELKIPAADVEEITAKRLLRSS